ncbi:aga1 a-agglutinin anchor subunit [Fusarium sporotrichioides]|uniref:Aga1 a-agglutinin anchor subunit n=1 Tax=Fusarium sporotrichioides TaxID=5514 RepID=A0A395RV57_FUSSP|nr:aga1 a-agglutinin anchor subunit [Fusarium sporotrichioides]
MSTLQRSKSIRKPAPSSSTATKATRTTAPATNAPDADHSPSRLPVKPLTRSATTSSTTTRTLRNGGTSLSRTTSVKQPTKPAASEPVKRETRYPPSTTTTRTRPAVRPTSADGPTQATRKAPAPSHTRAKSTATGLKNAPALRPTSSTSSASSTTTTSTTTTKSTRTLRSSTAPKVEKSSGTAPRLRPAFSTLQQHYSPAKSSAPKPLTSTFLAPPSPSKLPANVAASAETSRLQTELLQLHLLHRDAPAVDAAWRASAERKLGEQFSNLAAESKQIDDQEKAEVEKENILALRQWAVVGGLEERIQVLDSVMSGLWALEEPGGRYARAVRRFERWVERMCEIEEARREGGALLQESDVLFIGELDSAWKDECAGLVRRLDTLKRQLSQLGDFPTEGQGEDDTKEKSSLQRMVEGSRELVHGMLTELNVMEDIERDALAREDDWIERMNRDEDVDDTPRAGAIWRVV